MATGESGNFSHLTGRFTPSHDRLIRGWVLVLCAVRMNLLNLYQKQKVESQSRLRSFKVVGCKLLIYDRLY